MYMSKRSAKSRRAARARAGRKRNYRVKSQAATKLGGGRTDLAELPAEAAGVLGVGVEVQAGRLGDVRWQTVQRQAMAVQNEQGAVQAIWVEKSQFTVVPGVTNNELVGEKSNSRVIY